MIFERLRLNLSDQNALDNPALLLTVHNINKGIIKYPIAVKSLMAGGSNHTAAKLIYSVSKDKQRLIEDFTIDTSNLKIFWKDAIDTTSVLTVQLA
ncbi:hypothetical protein IEQ_04996 [Bacillus cereus BAG6X1-2]|nr:hypothetical protein IEQ_04996 [Bacillus cereus BAG6X1-2]